jgi:hypothetical protein
MGPVLALGAALTKRDGRHLLHGRVITTLGYGDVVLKYPWRHLGTLIAITGVLMFGCSTAFLFLVLQEVWKLHKRRRPSSRSAICAARKIDPAPSFALSTSCQPVTPAGLIAGFGILDPAVQRGDMNRRAPMVQRQAQPKALLAVAVEDRVTGKGAPAQGRGSGPGSEVEIELT